MLYVAKDLRNRGARNDAPSRSLHGCDREPRGWTSQFREIVLDVDASLHDLRPPGMTDPVLDPNDYAAGQTLGSSLRVLGSDGIVYPSVRQPGGECAGLFYPDRASLPPRDAIWTIIGTASGLTSTAMSQPGRSTG